MGFLPVPTGCDSLGYIKLMRHKESGVTAFGVFNALIQWSAARPFVERGTIQLSVEEIADVLRMPVNTIEKSLVLLVQIGWLHNLAQPCARLRNLAPERNGTERKGKERKGIDDWVFPEGWDSEELRAELNEWFDNRSKNTSSRERVSKLFKDFDNAEHLKFAARQCAANGWQGIKPEYRKEGTATNGKPKQVVVDYPDF